MNETAQLAEVMYEIVKTNGTSNGPRPDPRMVL